MPKPAQDDQQANPRDLLALVRLLARQAARELVLPEDDPLLQALDALAAAAEEPA